MLKYLFLFLYFPTVLYSQSIKTIQVYKLIGNEPVFVGNTGIALLNSNENLYIEFDDLSSNFKNFSVKIVHLNMDGEVSRLRNADYLQAINNFPVTNYSLSENTKVSYYHYSFLVPKVRKSGRYRAEFYRSSERVPLFGVDFYVNAGLVSTQAQVVPLNDNEHYFQRQQININLNYGSINTPSPSNDFKVIIRKNFDPNSDQQLNKASYINAGAHQLEYSNFLNGNVFEGGNEYRTFDISSTFSPGRFVEEIVHNDYQDEAVIKVDYNKGGSLYFNNNDIDGLYRINTYDNSYAEINADYLKVKFHLSMPEISSKDVFIYGALSDFKLDSENLMEYNENEGWYEGTLVLKQGFYDYSYATKSKINSQINLTELEGNFYDTRNTYEIFVYFRPIGGRADELLSYQILKL